MPDDRRYTDPATTRLPSPGRPTPTPRRSGWVADPDEPSGWRWIRDLTSISAATHILPAVPMGRIDFQGAVDWAWPPGDPTFTHDDGSTYARCEPEEFEDYSEVDSTTIVDPGAPD